uniref:DNA-directed DNA polymerase n=1 Tax=Panagrolaimus superbus TaxID=310955 RepID=A0A914YXL3_9BILA
MVAMSKYLLSKKRHDDFGASRFVFRLAFDDMGAFDDPKAEFLEAIQSIINQILTEDSSIKKIGLVLSSSLLPKGDLLIPFTEIRSDFINIISNEIYKLQQSDGFTLLLDLPFNVTVTTHSPSRGRGKINNVRSFVKKTFLFDLDLNDGLCLFYSLCAAMAFYETKPNTVERRNVIVKYNGPVKSEILLPIYYSKKHYAAIKNLSMFTSGKTRYQWCEECETTFDRIVRHANKCVLKCGKCMTFGDGSCASDGSFITCNICNRYFESKICMDRHIKNNICNIVVTCDLCGATYSKRHTPDHTCNTRFCYTCKSYHETRECFVSVLPEREIVDYRIIIYDFETSCEEYIDEKTMEHTVVFIAAYVYCTRCIFNQTWQNEVFKCDICGPKRWYKWSAINGDDCMLNFIETILYEFNNKYKSTLLAHVSSRFDGIFVLRKLFELNISPKVIKKGNKFYLIRVPKRKDSCELAFKDTYLFMGASLDKLVTSFDLDVESKMFYPYEFIKRENFNVELQTLPPKHMYNYKYMKEDKQILFDEWYSRNYNTKFSLKDSLDEYCTSDVKILSHAVVAFLDLFYKITKTDPFQSQTISGACMKAYRTNFLPEQSISIMPENGYGSHDKASVMAIKYLMWVSKKDNIFIQHRNTLEGEKHVCGFKLDGFAPATNTAYEILGDVFHGCRICIKERDKIMPTGRTAEMDYQKTMERIEIIKDAGFNVILKWEHEIRNELKTNNDFKHFYDTEIIAGPISPRLALFGGRVSPQQLYTKAMDGYCIKYYDVRSLYPSIILCMSRC